MVKKIGDKNKNHVEYSCEICLKKFLQKIDLIRHNKKIKPCKKKNNIIKIENINDEKNDDLNDEKINFNEILDYKSDDDKIYIIDDNNDDFNIEKPNYNNILSGGKNNILDDKNDIFDNDNNNNMVLELMKKMDLLIKQNDKMNNDILKLNNEIYELKEDNEKLKNQIILSNKTSKNDIKNYINVNIQINNFNNVDYSKIDKKYLINTLLKENGKKIFLKTIKDFFVNPEKPENHNIYISDKNRKHLKIYNDGKWNTNDFKIIDTIIENIINIYKLSIEEIKNNNEIYQKIKKSIENKIKYLDLCDLEHLAELEDEQENDDIDNKDKIKRCKEFYEMVYNDIINLLHDNKDIILNTHKNNILTT
jgi:hypothetical protein